MRRITVMTTGFRWATALALVAVSPAASAAGPEVVQSAPIAPAQPSATGPGAPAVPPVVPPTQRAATATELIHLRDGAVVRGTITERRADGSIVVLLITGEVRTIPYAAIARVDEEPAPGGAPVSPNSQVPTVSTPPPVTVAPAFSRPPPSEHDTAVTREQQPGRVPIIVGATTGSLLLGNRTGTIHTVFSGGGYGTSRTETPVVTPLCATPCTLYARPGSLDLGVSVGPRTPYIQSFMVPDAGARVLLRTPSGGGMLGAVGLIVVGGIGAIAGPILTLYGLYAPIRSNPLPILVTGVITIPLCGAALVYGIILAMNSRAQVMSVQPLTTEPRHATRRAPGGGASIGVMPVAGGAFASLQFGF